MFPKPVACIFGSIHMKCQNMTPMSMYGPVQVKSYCSVGGACLELFRVMKFPMGILVHYNFPIQQSCLRFGDMRIAWESLSVSAADLEKMLPLGRFSPGRALGASLKKFPSAVLTTVQSHRENGLLRHLKKTQEESSFNCKSLRCHFKYLQ